jgi:hypothetical protein
VGLIKLKKTLTEEALTAMSRNTLIDGGGIDKEVMEKFLKLLAERLEKIPNENLKRAIDESVREKAMEKLMTATVKDVDKIVKGAFDDIVQALGVAPKKPRAPRKKPAAPRSPSWGYGGK